MPSIPPQPDLPEAIRRAWRPDRWRQTHLLVAVSGGADSVALLHGVLAVKREAGGDGRVFAAHFNHKVRGAESDADEAFVRRLGDELGVPVEVGRARGGDELTSEEAARDARYAFLLRTAEALGTRYVATGHTADDQLETVLLRVLRGAGLGGLAGVPAARALGPSVTVVRPLLGVRRAEVEAYLAALGQEFRTDTSNAEERFARNRVRNVLLPELRDSFGAGVDDAILRLSEQAGEAQEVIAGLARDLAATAVARSGDDSIAVSPADFAGAAPLVAREALKFAWRDAGWPEQAMGAGEWRRLHALLSNGPEAAPIHLPGGVDARWVAGRVVLRRV